MLQQLVICHEGKYATMLILVISYTFKIIPAQKEIKSIPDIKMQTSLKL